MKQHIATMLLVVLLLVLFSPVASVSAQDGDDSVWGEVLNPDGSINYDNLTDGGIVTESADWMPDIPLIGPVEAVYHIYETPSGNLVQLPSATTLFFMALNPQASGMTDVSSSLFSGAGTMLSTAGIISAMLNGSGSIDFSGTDYVNSEQFADAVIAGDADIWSLGTGDILNLVWNLASMSIEDGSLYTALLLYTPDNIPPEFAELFDLYNDDDIDIPAPARCPAPVVTPGIISTEGLLIAPNYPLVTGQDPDKRGVDISFSASVAPTIHTYYTEVPVFDDACRALNFDGQASDCTRPNGLPGQTKREIVGWECQQHKDAYPETFSLAYGEIRLTQESKDWILDTLSIRYPGAYVHNPKFTWPASSGSSTWSYTAQRAPVADPGEWAVYVGGQTSGTPVSDSRGFGGPAGLFDVWLKETALVQ